jgi:hypothetical protein
LQRALRLLEPQNVRHADIIDSCAGQFEMLHDRTADGDSTGARSARPDGFRRRAKDAALRSRR